MLSASPVSAACCIIQLWGRVQQFGCCKCCGIPIWEDMGWVRRKFCDTKFLLKPQVGTDFWNIGIIIIKFWYVQICSVVDWDQILDGEFCLKLHRKRVNSYKLNVRILHSLEIRFMDGEINSFSSKYLARDLFKGNCGRFNSALIKH
jgi:hypothetical protein